MFPTSGWASHVLRTEQKPIGVGKITNYCLRICAIFAHSLVVIVNWKLDQQDLKGFRCDLLQFYMKHSINCHIFIHLKPLIWGWNPKHCWLMTFTWKISSFTSYLPLRCYLPWLDHIKIISNHHAITMWVTTRSIGKFAEKLISCQGHFHYTGWLSLQGCYPVPVTLSTI